MPKLAFTPHLRRHAPPAALTVSADTPRAALELIFREYPQLRGYVLDEQGSLRKHVALFIDGELRREALDSPVADDAEIYVMQALSGG